MLNALLSVDVECCTLATFIGCRLAVYNVTVLFSSVRVSMSVCLSICVESGKLLIAHRCNSDEYLLR